MLEIEVDKLLCGGLVETKVFEYRSCFIDNAFIEGVSVRDVEIGVSLRGPGWLLGLRFADGF